MTIMNVLTTRTVPTINKMPNPYKKVDNLDKLTSAHEAFTKKMNDINL